LRLSFAVSQGLRLLRGNKPQTLLLLLCYTAGILLPLAMFAYRKGVLDSADAEPQADSYVAMANNITGEKFAKLTDYGELGGLLRSAGEGFSVSVTDMSSAETAVELDGRILRGSVMWRLPADESGLVYDTLAAYPRTGRYLSNDEPFGIVLGDGLLRGVKNPEALLGRSLALYGETYTVIGIIHGTSVITGNILSREYGKMVSMVFRGPPNSAVQARALAMRLDEAFSVTQFSALSVSEQYAAEVRRSSAQLLAVAFAGLAFCLLNSLGLVNSFLFDCKKKLLVKMSVGARPGELFLELWLFWCALLLGAALLAFLLSLAAIRYLDAVFFHSPSVSPQAAIALPLIILLSATLASLYSVRKVMRRRL
jgi:hypothetical protein